MLVDPSPTRVSWARTSTVAPAWPGGDAPLSPRSPRAEEPPHHRGDGERRADGGIVARGELVAERRRGLFRIAVIALHQRWRANDEFAGDVVRDVPAFIVDNQLVQGFTTAADLSKTIDRHLAGTQ